MTTKPSLFPNTNEMSYSFGLAGETRLHVDEGYSPLSAWRALSHHIIRYPLDLRAHTQRILLGHNNDEISNFLPGSLQDLFLVLENSGMALKKQLLSQSEQYLTNDEFSFFEHWFQQDNKNEQQCFQSGSVLSSGNCRGKLLLKKEEREIIEAGYTDVLEEARACLDHGQLDVAQQLLEDEIIKHPNAKDIEEELLTIYQYSKNSKQLKILSQQLLKQGVTLSEQWIECQKKASLWDVK